MGVNPFRSIDGMFPAQAQRVLQRIDGLARFHRERLERVGFRACQAAFLREGTQLLAPRGAVDQSGEREDEVKEDEAEAAGTLAGGQIALKDEGSQRDEEQNEREESKITLSASNLCSRASSRSMASRSVSKRRGKVAITGSSTQAVGRVSPFWSNYPFDRSLT